MIDEQDTIDGPTDLIVRRPPARVLAEAREAAVALTEVISAKPRKVMFNGEQYLEFEDWQTVGRFYGVTAKVVETKFVEYGAVKGFAARAVALRADGMEISAAESECLNDEDRWSSRPKYVRLLHLKRGDWVPEEEAQKLDRGEWVWIENPNKPGSKMPEGRREQVGVEAVPLFQLKSMAQTRACAKVLRNVLAWVVVLAGYRPTPAEELQTTDYDNRPSSGGKSEPSASASASAQASSDGTTHVVAIKSIKKGATNGKDWEIFAVKFKDAVPVVGGVVGETASEGTALLPQKKGAIQHAENALKACAKVRPKLVKKGEYVNLEGFEELTATASEAPEPQEPVEPIDGPEGILTIRQRNTNEGPYWVIQTSKRELVTETEGLAKGAEQARADKVKLTPRFNVVPKKGGGTVCQLVGWEELMAPTAAPAAREPGEDDQ